MKERITARYYLNVSWCIVRGFAMEEAIIIHVYNLYLHFFPICYTWQLSCYFMVFYGILYFIDGLNNLPAIYLQFYDP